MTSRIVRCIPTIPREPLMRSNVFSENVLPSRSRSITVGITGSVQPEDRHLVIMEETLVVSESAPREACRVHFRLWETGNLKISEMIKY